MITNRPIVAGIDGSSASLRAARWAAATAVARNRPLRLVTAFDWPLGTFTVGTQQALPDPEEVEAAARQGFAEHLAALREEFPTLRLTRDFVKDRAVHALIAETLEAELTVLGRRGLGGLTGLLLGSVSTQVSAHAAGPVVVVPDRPSLPGPVVVGVDGSTGSQTALGFAFEEASWRAADLVVVHAWPRPADIDRYGYNLYPEDTQMLADTERTLLGEALAGWREKYPDVTVRAELVKGDPADRLVEIGRYARLVVVGSRGHGTVAGVLLGSVSRAVLHRAAGPVAIVHPRRD